MFLQWVKKYFFFQNKIQLIFFLFQRYWNLVRRSVPVCVPWKWKPWMKSLKCHHKISFVLKIFYLWSIPKSPQSQTWRGQSMIRIPTEVSRLLVGAWSPSWQQSSASHVLISSSAIALPHLPPSLSPAAPPHSSNPPPPLGGARSPLVSGRH